MRLDSFIMFANKKKHLATLLLMEASFLIGVDVLQCISVVSVMLCEFRHEFRVCAKLKLLWHLKFY
jgi:hypothetical protein